MHYLLPTMLETATELLANLLETFDKNWTMERREVPGKFTFLLIRKRFYTNPYKAYLTPFGWGSYWDAKVFLNKREAYWYYRGRRATVSIRIDVSKPKNRQRC